jgi:hypothetical protein
MPDENLIYAACGKFANIRYSQDGRRTDQICEMTNKIDGSIRSGTVPKNIKWRIISALHSIKK